MPTQSEIDSMLVLLYRSNNASDYINYSRPAGWLDKLPLDGFAELIELLDVLKEEVRDEAKRRLPLTTASIERAECDCCGQMKPDVESVFIPHVGDTSACADCRNSAAGEIERPRSELKAWRDRFPMCHYDPDAGSIFSDSEPR